MRAQEWKQAKDRRPFTPFAIRTADGREVTISHPEAISWEGHDYAPHLFVILPGGRWEIIDSSLVTSISIEAPTSAIPEKRS